MHQLSVFNLRLLERDKISATHAEELERLRATHSRRRRAVYNDYVKELEETYGHLGSAVVQDLQTEFLRRTQYFDTPWRREDFWVNDMKPRGIMPTERPVASRGPSQAGKQGKDPSILDWADRLTLRDQARLRASELVTALDVETRQEIRRLESQQAEELQNIRKTEAEGRRADVESSWEALTSSQGVIKSNRSWMPWADRLLVSTVIASLLLVLLPTILFPNLEDAGHAFPAAAASACLICLAGYFPAVLSHYRLLLGGLRSGRLRNPEPPERVVVIVTLMVSIATGTAVYLLN